MVKKQSDKWSTNKRVKPGDKNTTSAKTVRPMPTEAEKTAKRRVGSSLKGQKWTEDYANKTKKERGFFTQREALTLQHRLKTRRPVI